MNAITRPDFATRLDRLAEIAVHVGLGLEPGQEVLLTAPLDSLPLVRRITEHAYRAGASLVTTVPCSSLLMFTPLLSECGRVWSRT